MSRLISAGVLLAILATPARGQLQVPDVVRLQAGGMPQVVTIANESQVPVAVVNTTPALGFWQIVSPSPNRLAFLAFSLTPGQYEVAFLVNGKQATEPPVESARVRVVVDGGGPVPPTPPTPTPPGPTPPTPPVAQKLFLVVIEETANATQRRTAFMLDQGLRARMTAKGHGYRLADKDIKDGNGAVPKDLAPYLTEAAGKPLPHLFIVPAVGGRALYSGPVPETPAGLVSLLEKVGG